MGIDTPQLTKKNTFDLIGYFSIASFVALLVTLIVLTTLYRQILVSNLIALRQNNNEALAQIFANSLDQEYLSFLDTAARLDADSLQNHPETLRLRELVLKQWRNSSVLKVKVYNQAGLTVFSTEAAQIGEDKSTNDGFIMAAGGEIASELTHRNQFSAFEQVVEDRDVVSSYIPVHAAGGQEIDAVFEIYDDVTPFMQQIDTMQRYITVVLLLVLFTLYMFLYMVIREGNRVVQRLHNNLESQVEQRTRDLSHANRMMVLEVEERRRAEFHLEVARDKAVNALEIKNQIIANVSHDVRTPLNIIMLYADLITRKDTQLPDSVKQKLDVIQQSSRELLHFFDNLLHAARLQSGEIHPEYQPMNLQSQCDYLQKAYAPLAEQKGLNLLVKMNQNMPETVCFDPDWFKQIMSNLVTNAIKFTHSGSITVSISKFDETRWSLVVQDTGIGISVSDLDEIFSPFWQADASSTRVVGRGVGLGLSIVKQFVEKLNGKISVISAVDKGTTFTLTFAYHQEVPL